MAIPQAIQDVIRLANEQAAQESALENLKLQKTMARDDIATLQAKVADLTVQIQTQLDAVTAARAALKAAAALI